MQKPHGPVSAYANRDSAALMNVALGRKPGDLALINARLVNVYTGEILPNQSIVTCGPWIAYTGDQVEDGMIGTDTEVIDAMNRVVIPGLIDGHTHLAMFFNIAELVRHTAPGGTTTLITEACEPYAVGGYAGIDDFLGSLADQPIKFFVTAPPVVSIQRKDAGIDPHDLERLLAREEILGLGESYWQGVFQSPQKMLPAMQRTLAAGKKLEGHSAGARGAKLAAYTALGVSSCHEPITAEEALARLRLGMTVMVREGNVRRDLAAIAQIRHMGVDLRRLTLVSDGVDPKTLLTEGYMEALVQRAIGYGFDPITAIRMATLNVAEHFAIDHLVGGLAPGRYADWVVIPEVDRISAEMVVSNGRVIVRGKQMVVAPREHVYALQSRNSIRLPRELGAADFALRVETAANEAAVTVIEMVTDLVTRKKIVGLPVDQGQIQIPGDRGLNKIAAVDRKHTPGHVFTGLISGFNLRAGAIAASVAWDTSNLIVIGADDADMAAAINRLRDLGGGIAVSCNRRVVAELALPIWGMISELSMVDLSERLEMIQHSIQQLGVAFPDPLLSLSTMTGAAIPYLRICDEGLVDFKSGRTESLVDAAHN